MRKLTIAIIVCIILIAIYSIYRTKADTHTKQTAIAVTVSKALSQNVTLELSAIGNTTAYSTVQILAQVSGQLLTVNFKEGAYVIEKQLLFKIDPRPYQVQLQEAQANLAKDQAQYTNAQLILNRNIKLIKQGYVSKQDFDQVNANKQVLAATIQADKAALANAKLQLSYCTITAPISGRTGSLLVYPGNLISANSLNPMVTINQMQPIYITFTLPEQNLHTLQNYLAANGNISVKAYNNKNQKLIAEGKLSFINNTVDPTTGTIQLKAEFANSDLKLWPGQFVTIKLPIKNYRQATLVPTNAIQMGPNGSYVFIINTDNTVAMRNVTLGHEIDKFTIIKDGIKPGEKVVTSGQMHLIEGSKVVVRPALDKS